MIKYILFSMLFIAGCSTQFEPGESPAPKGAVQFCNDNPTHQLCMEYENGNEEGI